MSEAKSHLLLVAEWLWAQRGKNLSWQPHNLSQGDIPPGAPRMGMVEATRCFEILAEKQLLLKRSQDGKRFYYLNDQKYVEWQNFLNYLQGKGNNETETLMQDAAPDVTEFWKYSLYHIRKNWKHLWAAKYAIGSLLREIGG